VRRRISPLMRSRGIVAPYLGPVLGWEGTEGQDVACGVEEVGHDVDKAGLGQLVVTSASGLQVVSRSGCSKIEHTKVTIMGQLPLAQREARLAMQWGVMETSP
jgi:hypothetical protein